MHLVRPISLVNQTVNDKFFNQFVEVLCVMPPFNDSPVTLRKESTVLTIPTAHVKAANPQNIMIEADDRSVYVGNVEYAATPEDLEEHFQECGPINRVTILGNKFDGHPKGFAYIEFGDKDSAQAALALNESLFKGRQIKVKPKRTNKPGLSTTNRPPRSMRGRGRSFRGGFSPYYSRFSPYYSSFSPNYSGFSPNYSGYRPVRRGRNNPYVYVNNTASKK